MYRKGFPHFLRHGFAKFVFFAAMAILFIFLIGNVVMYLWNWILPEAIGAKEITFWKAIGLFVLTRILFGGFKSHGSSRRGRGKGRFWKDKWMGMNEEERQAFKQQWRTMSRDEKREMKQQWKEEFRKSRKEEKMDDE